MDDRERYAKGLEVRRAVLGDKHVNRSIEKSDSFTEEFQDLVTRYAWGGMWTRPGLPRHTRSLITLAMLIALNRGEEIRLHLRGALNNGGTRDQLKELFMQAVAVCIHGNDRREVFHAKVPHRLRDPEFH